MAYLTSEAIANELGLSHTLVKSTIKKAGIAYYPNRHGAFLLAEDATAKVASALLQNRAQRKAKAAARRAYNERKETKKAELALSNPGVDLDAYHEPDSEVSGEPIETKARGRKKTTA